MGTRDSQEVTGGLSRRELLKRSAVAGGVVWASPSVLASAAGAQVSSLDCPDGSCPVYHAIKLNTIDPLPPREELCDYQESGYNSQPAPLVEDMSGNFNTSNFSCGYSEATAAAAALVETSCAEFQSHVSTISADGLTITLKSGYQFVVASKKQGTDCIDSRGNCSSATFSGTFSHLELVYCGPT